MTPNIWSSLGNSFDRMYRILFVDGYWKAYVQGMKNTLLLTFGSLFIGLIIGTIVAVIKYIHKEIPLRSRVSRGIFSVLNFISGIYTTIVRGTPMLLQLIIFSTVIFASAPINRKLPIAILAFGINSGAYVSEIIRSGLLSVDKGQNETGRSLGLDQLKTMWYIVLPQAIKNIIPALFNEIIALLKETSIASTIYITDVTYVASLIRSGNSSGSYAIEPLIISAFIYLTMVVFLEFIQRLFEKGLSKK